MSNRNVIYPANTFISVFDINIFHWDIIRSAVHYFKITVGQFDYRVIHIFLKSAIAFAKPSDCALALA